MVTDTAAGRDAGLMAAMHRTEAQWAAVNPSAFLDGSIVQAKNVIEMARADILRLYAALAAERRRAEADMRERAWQPMETAPKDGCDFLAYGSYLYHGDAHATEYTRVACYDGDDRDFPWWDEEGGHPNGFFSHWYPLPPAPHGSEP